MAQARKTLVDRIGQWRLLAGNLRPHLDEFPQLDREVEELERMHAEAQALVSEIALRRGELQEATARLRTLARGGDMLRTRVGAVLRGILGYESEHLVQYGFRPRPRHHLDRRLERSPSVQPTRTAGREEVLDDLSESEPS